MPFYCYFLLTLLLELPIVCWFFKPQWKYALLIGGLLNLFSWPLLHWFIYTTNLPIFILEIGVVLVEAIGFRIFLTGSYKKALGVSLLANGFSYGVGLLINYLWS